MAKELTAEVWAALRAPFKPEELSFRIQSTFERGGETVAVVVAYVSSRAVQDRLDDVLEPDGWGYDLEPIGVNNGELRSAKGTLSIVGAPYPKSDVGDASATEPTKSTASDTFKRTAVLWGIGRELYSMPKLYATPELRKSKRGDEWTLPDAEVERLRQKIRDMRAGRGARDVAPVKTKTGREPAQPVQSAPRRLEDVETVQGAYEYSQAVHMPQQTFSKFNRQAAGDLDVLRGFIQGWEQERAESVA